MAQLVEQLHITPVIRSSNPVIGKFHLLYKLIEKKQTNEKRGREWPPFKIRLFLMGPIL